VKQQHWVSTPCPTQCSRVENAKKVATCSPTPTTSLPTSPSTFNRPSSDFANPAHQRISSSGLERQMSALRLRCESVRVVSVPADSCVQLQPSPRRPHCPMTLSQFYALLRSTYKDASTQTDCAGPMSERSSMLTGATSYRDGGSGQWLLKSN